MGSLKIDAIAEVRKRTLAPIKDCKVALELNSWDVSRACLDIARAKHDAKNGAHDAYGTVAMYSHEFGRVGVMVELSCESGYVAKSHEFVKLANIIAIHIAWSNPKFVSRDDIDPREVEAARENFMESLAPLSSTAGTLDDRTLGEQYREVVDIAMDTRFYPKLCLLEQPEIKETQGKETIGSLVAAMSAKTGEKITVVRFARFKVGVV